MDPLLTVGATTSSNPRQATRAPDLASVEALLAAAVSSENREQALHLRQQAVLLSLDLAGSCARRYSRRGAELEDLVQVAHAALVKAANRYLPGRGSGFRAYASVTIQGEIKHYFRDCCWAVRPPRSLQEKREVLVVEQERLRHELRREPTHPELAKALGWSATEVAEVVASRLAFESTSLDHDAWGQSGWADARFARDESGDIVNRLALVSGLKALSSRERHIVKMKFVDEWTQTQIGDELGVSQMQVSRLLHGIIARLRAQMELTVDVA